MTGWVGWKALCLSTSVAYTGGKEVGSVVRLFFTFPHAFDGFDVSSNVFAEFFRVNEER